MKKGFTLIELLAVIVILAIIALIATPIILGIINDAKEDSEKRSIENYAHAVELAVARYSAGNEGVIPVGKYKAGGKKLTNNDDKAEPKMLEIDYKGEEITGDVEITKKGEVKITDASVGNGKTKYNYSEKDGVTKKEDAVTQPSSPFKVSDSGVLLHYERQGDETSVVVPAEVNGIKIKSIAPEAFLIGDIFLMHEYNLVIGLTEKARENASLAEQFNMDFIMIDEFGKGNDPVVIPLDMGDSASGGGKFLLSDENSSEPLIWPLEYLGSYYLKDIDMSKMKYLEIINPASFKGLYSNSSDACYSASTCPTGTLEKVKFPMNGVLTTIGEYAFEFNLLTEVEIPSSVTTIDRYAFSHNKLASISLNEGIVKLEEYAFYHNQLENVIIPSTVNKIGYVAFSQNPNLTKITIKRADSTGMEFGSYWNGSAAIEYNMN